MYPKIVTAFADAVKCMDRASEGEWGYRPSLKNGAVRVRRGEMAEASCEHRDLTKATAAQMRVQVTYSGSLFIPHVMPPNRNVAPPVGAVNDRYTLVFCLVYARPVLAYLDRLLGPPGG